MLQKFVPLCSSQYERQFNTVRIPGKEAGRNYFLSFKYIFRNFH